MKCRFGSVTSPRDNHEMVEAAPIGGDEGGEPLRITHAQLITVIRQRTEQIATKSKPRLRLGFSGPVGRQVVLTGAS
jgi:cell division protein FtsA